VKKLAVFLLLIFGVFFGGCKALTMTPDAWLDPHRWDQEAIAKAKSASGGFATAEPARSK